MVARALLVALPLVSVLLLVGCGGVRVVTSRPRPDGVLYVGQIDMPYRPDEIETRRKRAARISPPTAGAVVGEIHAYVEVSAKVAIGPGGAVRAVAGYVTWF